MNGMADGIYKVSEWFMRFAYINLLFIFFTSIGLVLFGIVPAFIAMLAVMRKWFAKEEFPVFKRYWDEYKKEFIKGNGIGFIFFVVGSILALNFYLVQQIDHMVQLPLKYGMVMITFLFVITFLYVFPIRAQYKMSIWDCIKYAFILGVSHPLSFLLWLAGLFLIFITLRFIPGLIPFYSICLVGAWSYWVTKRVLSKAHPFLSNQ
ncbi:hypothetical protein AB685_28240 [Bacillus sp. LL01]|uniref:YesL family protein n=1 Tax=Bacillus sp. LL01 TaxID=1665556 RepID=UPI00064D24E0|nr:YesL family protein [Bacillus sp. LL01]KMJ55247.1 hypothetical protein AB685_28240 [Bacillus sp. LL01]